MKRFGWMSAVVIGLALATTACGGGGKADGAADAADAEGKAIDRLKASVKGLDDEVNGLFKPVDDLEAALNGIAELPAKLKASAGVQLDAKAFASVGKGVIEGKLDLAPLKLEAKAEAKAEVEAVFKNLESALKGLKETDAKVKAIGDKFASALLEIPKLGVEASASASVDIANPFAGAEIQAQAKADLEEIKKIVDEFPKMVEGWKEKVTGLPDRSAKAMEKVSTTFK